MHKVDNVEEKVDDFWDSHTHSPPVQQRRSMDVKKSVEEDFWGDNQEIRVPPPDESPVRVEVNQNTDFWDSVQRKSANSNVS